MDKAKVLATVAGREITSKDVEFLVGGLDPRTAAQFNSEEGRQQLLTELVNQELLYRDAVDNGMEDDDEYKAEVERVKIQILKQYSMNRLLGGVTVEEGELIDYYNKNKDHFNNPETIRASHILVSDEVTARKILKEIDEGLSFEDAATKYSSCPSKDQGGDLGYFPRKSMVPEFEEAAFSMKEGQVSSPVKTQFGFHIIKLVDRKQGGIKSFDETREQIVQQVTLKKQQDLYLNKTGELKKKYEVILNK